MSVWLAVILSPDSVSLTRQLQSLQLCRKRESHSMLFKHGTVQD
jgi:hypothetical protein